MKNVSTNASCKTKFCKVCKDAGKSNFTNHNVKEKNHLTGELVTVCPTLLSAECRYCFEQGHIAKYCPIIASKNKETAPLEYKNNKLPQKKCATIKSINSNPNPNPISKIKVQSAFAALNNDSSDDENDTTTTIFTVTQKKKQRIEQVDDHASSFQQTKKTKTNKHVTFHTDESTPVPNKTYESEFPSMSAPTPSKPVTTMKKLSSSSFIKQPAATNENISFATVAASSKPKEDVNETRGVQEKLKDNWTVFDCLQLKTTTPTPKDGISDTTKQKEVQKYLKRITKSWADASDDETEDEDEYEENKNY
jgi:hypothetical protein